MSGSGSSLDDVKMIDVNDASLAVSSFGNGPPVLLVHAYPMRRQLYRDVVGPLSETHHVIACDNRGFGQSSVTSGCVSIAQYADDLSTVLDTVRVTGPAIVCGVSMGGYIAMQLAERYPDQVAGLFLCNTRAAADTEDVASKRESLAKKIETEGAAVCRSVPEKLLGLSTQEADADLVEELRAWILATDPVGIAAALRGMAGRPDSTDLIRSFERPVHFVGGREDTFTPFDEMAALTVDCRRGITVLERCGHLSPIEQPESWVGAFNEFVAQNF